MIAAAPPPFYEDQETTAIQGKEDPAFARMRVAVGSTVGIRPEWRWEMYLAELPEKDDRISPQHTHLVSAFWRGVNARLGFQLPVPVTQPTEDGAIQLAWSKGRYYVDVDIYSDASAAWFFKNSETETVAGSGDDQRIQLNSVPLIFLNRLRLLR